MKYFIIFIVLFFLCSCKHKNINQIDKFEAERLTFRWDEKTAFTYYYYDGILMDSFRFYETQFDYQKFKEFSFEDFQNQVLNFREEIVFKDFNINTIANYFKRALSSSEIIEYMRCHRLISNVSIGFYMHKMDALVMCKYLQLTAKNNYQKIVYDDLFEKISNVSITYNIYSFYTLSLSITNRGVIFWKVWHYNYDKKVNKYKVYLITYPLDRYRLD